MHVKSKQWKLKRLSTADKRTFQRFIYLFKVAVYSNPGHA